MATSRRHTARPDATKPREIGMTVSDAMCTAFETVARVVFFYKFLVRSSARRDIIRMGLGRIVVRIIDPSLQTANL